ncbi:MAG: TetR/AcrR family transcriptional regulator [Syntrophomonadaceae bacterium]|nr:TetR/AcrR family transcriptional regulator [Syntrophomonadaceae bacterium]
MGIRERILAACRELARVKGFYNMSMDELARQAGVSKRTVYRYFRSKEEVIEASLDDFMAQMALEVEKILKQEEPAPEMIAAVMKQLFTHGQFITNPVGLNDLRVHYPQLWAKIDAFRLEKARGTISVFIQQSKNQVLQETDPRIITAITLASIQAVINPDFIIENGLTFESTITQLSKFLMASFS